jgi:hypothetical protein
VVDLQQPHGGVEPVDLRLLPLDVDLEVADAPGLGADLASPLLQLLLLLGDAAVLLGDQPSSSCDRTVE